jgi:hypothetical protein
MASGGIKDDRKCRRTEALLNQSCLRDNFDGKVTNMMIYKILLSFFRMRIIEFEV